MFIKFYDFVVNLLLHQVRGFWNTIIIQSNQVREFHTWANENLFALNYLKNIILTHSI